LRNKKKSHELAFGIIGFAKLTAESNEIMAQVHLTLEDEILKDLILGNRENKVAKLLEKVFDAVLRRQGSEKALLLSLMEMVVQGVSTRKISKITETLCGTSFSNQRTAYSYWSQ
jgi:hypothetical protein